MGDRFMQPLRLTIQWLYLLFIVYLGSRFYLFVLQFQKGAETAPIPRPDGIEGFLPIAALLGIRNWLDTGRLNQVHPAAVVILLAAILISLLLRRSFCSWICPVGTVEELLWKCGFKMFRRNLAPPRWLDLILRSPKYLLLAFFIHAIFITMSADQVSLFIASDYNKIADVRLLDFFRHLSGISLLFFMLLLLLSLPLKNPFCRFLCPYGALLGLAAVCSPVKVTRNRELCISCGSCNQACPASLPVMTKERLHSTECIGCWRCISYCRVDGVLAMRLPGKKTALPGMIFTLLVLLLFIGGTVTGKMTGNWHTGITVAEYGRLLGIFH